MHGEAERLGILIKQFTNELEDWIRKHCPLGRQFVLGEMFCPSQSPITHQVAQMGHAAFRFGYDRVWQSEIVSIDWETPTEEREVQSRLRAMVVMESAECIPVT